MTHDFLRTLTDAEEAPCVSVYLPLQAGSAHSDDNVKRLLAALDEVETKLQGTGLSSKGQKQFLASARTFAENECKNLFDGGTVALFLTPSSFHTKVLLKTDVERTSIGRRFYLAPLLPYLSHALRYFLLTVSKKTVKLYAVENDHMEEQEVEGMPVSMEDAWKGMERQEPSLQSHSTGSGTSAIHGHGGAKDVQEQEEDRFMQQIAKSLHTMLREQDRPLIFAGVTELFGMFRTFDKSDRLLDRYVAGSPDGADIREIKATADDIAREHASGRVMRLLEEYGALVGTGRTSTDLAAILDAALRGKIDLLLMRTGGESWGSFDAETGTVTAHEHVKEGEEEELIGLAAVHCLLHRGRLATMDASDMPEGAAMAAILRY